jgi:hypothetical protein
VRIFEWRIDVSRFAFMEVTVDSMVYGLNRRNWRQNYLESGLGTLH